MEIFHTFEELQEYNGYYILSDIEDLIEKYNLKSFTILEQYDYSIIKYYYIKGLK